MKIIHAPNAPKALGPYCSAIRTGNLLFCSGQTGIDPLTNKVESTTIDGQTKQVLANLKAVLASEGLGVKDVVKCNVYLSDMQHFKTMNAVYGDFFEGHTPARTTVAVAGLPLDALVEIECIAEIK
ncbi:Rid family detoxifying hydrolase [Roseivirga sp.]|uniref:RidA family protein n=1 Tax=Roseivirga sp. TaxID=1964215 RepID=UPI002B2646E4|nr:Rid family detoxifying hydrolase [Roseivirga sp.]